MPRSLGQLPLFPTPSDRQPTESPHWDLNKAYTCGKFWCSDVYIYDDYTENGRSILTPELTLTVFITHNVREFNRVQDLKIEDWQEN